MQPYTIDTEDAETFTVPWGVLSYTSVFSFMFCCSTSPFTCALLWSHKGAFVLKNTSPILGKQERVGNKEHIRTEESFKAMFFSHRFWFLFLLFIRKHMALPKGKLNE